MNILDLINSGGIIVYILIFLNIMGFTLIISKIITIIKISKIKNEIIYKIDKIDIKQDYNEHLENTIQFHIKPYEFGLNTIRTIATISPLLGLLGTVLGILLSFDTISKTGLQDPTLFSSSIALALITTVVGLIVSIPHYIFYNYYSNLLYKIQLDIFHDIINKK